MSDFEITSRRAGMSEPPKGHREDGLYVLPLMPVPEAVKRILGRPVMYMYVYKRGQRLSIQFRQEQ